MAKKEWIITVDDDALSRLDEVVAELESRGFEVLRVLRTLGQVTGCTEVGSAAADPAPSALSSVPGVRSVDTVQTYTIRPSGADLQ